MKRIKTILPALAAVICLAGCEHKNIAEDIVFNVTLDETNTYYAGEPVKFNFTGNADNIVFYSGENGSSYKYKDRYTVPTEDVNAATLSLKILGKYGYLKDGYENKPDKGMVAYISNSFKGLSGTDTTADRALIQSIIDKDMEGWTRLDYTDPGSDTETIKVECDLTDYLDNFCLAFHWNPYKSTTSAQRTYYVEGDVTLDLKGTAPSTIGITDLNMISFMMNKELPNPYIVNSNTDLYDANGNMISKKDKGLVYFNKNGYDIVFQGIAQKTIIYELDGWVFTTPQALNKVQNDSGVTIKNLQNYMYEYEYTFEEPGTYTVTFAASNYNYMGQSSQLRELTLNIVEKPE